MKYYYYKEVDKLTDPSEDIISIWRSQYQWGPDVTLPKTKSNTENIWWEWFDPDDREWVSWTLAPNPFDLHRISSKEAMLFTL